MSTNNHSQPPAQGVRTGHPYLNAPHIQPESGSPTPQAGRGLGGGVSRRTFLVSLAGGLIALACSDTDDAASTATSELPSPTTDPPTSPATIAPAPTATPLPEASLEEKVAQMLMVGYRGTTTDNIDPTAEALAAGRLGNTVLFDHNVVGPGQLAALDAWLQDGRATPMLISVDQEGGRVARLRPDKGFPETVTALFLGNRNDLDLTYRYASGMAGAMAAAGINLNLAPVVDVNVSPSNPAIGLHERSFSADPDVVAQQALTFIQAHHDAGVLCTLKHFAGHGSSTADSHLGFVDVTTTWSEAELIPFQRVIEAGQADAIMTAHIFNANIDPTYPGTLSEATINGLLRTQLGYDGVVITDDMQMGAISQYFGFDRAIELAILAGSDIISVANTLTYDPNAAQRAFDAVMAAVARGIVTEERIDQSYRRILLLKARLA